MKKLVFASLFLALGTFVVNAQSTQPKKGQKTKKTTKQAPPKPETGEPEHTMSVNHENADMHLADKEQEKPKAPNEEKQEHHPVNPNPQK